MPNPFHPNTDIYRDPRINRNGAPTLQNRVRAWYDANPDGSISQCARELGITRNTARKWKPEPELEQSQSQGKSKVRRIWDILKE